MKGKLLALILPASVLGIVLAGGVWAAKMKFIPPDVWRYLWPSLVAVLFLALAIGAFMIGAIRWLWAPLAGFVVQTVGILLMLPKKGFFRYPLEILWWSLGAVGVVLALMLVIWLIVTLRARWLEQKMLQGVGGDSSLDQQELQKIRNNMQEAIGLLKRAGRGRNALYELPWFLVIGRPAAGKTVAIKNSKLGLPVRKDWVKGVGGTHTCDFFFTNDLIFMDTPGKWVLEGTGEEGKRTWIELLRLLRKYRGRRPLDGLVVVVPSDDLLGKTDDELQDLASNIREVIDLLHAELKFRFPVYVLVSKCDLVDGFVEFFRGVPAQRRDEILGWSHEDPNEGEVRRLIPSGFRRLLRRLDAYRLEMLAKSSRRTEARKLFFFTEEFKRLQRPLTVFADILFLEDPAGDPPVFRGFYFTSGTQGEGSPLGSALSQLAHNLGIRVTQGQAGAEEEPKRSYFLLELFRNLMVGDEGLVSRTAVHWWRRRRDTMFAAFLPAAAAGLFILMSLLSFLLNKGVYEEIRAEVPSVVNQVRQAHAGGEAPDVFRALNETRKLEGFHYKLTGPTLLRGFGMRHPGTLEWETRTAFKNEFLDAVLKPTLARAQEIVIDPNESCTTKAETFYSVVWLRQGHMAESGDDLGAFDRLWDLPKGERAEDARAMLLEQFSYLTDYFPSDSLLPGISLQTMAESVRDGCKTEGSGSVLENYRDFQDQCGAALTPAQKSDCYSRLQAIVGFHKEDYQRLVDHLEWLQRGLERIQDAELQAGPALKAIQEIPAPKPDANECVVEFGDEILPAIQSYMEADDGLIDECRSAYAGDRRNLSKALQVLRSQREVRKKDQDEVEKKIKDFAVRCGARRLPVRMTLNPGLPARVSTDYIMVACRGENEMAAESVPPPAPAVERPQPIEPAAPGRSAAPVASSGLRVFEPPRQPSKAYTAEAWQTKRREWAEELENYRAMHEDIEVSRLTHEISDYGRESAAAWKEYLQSLKLRERKTGVVEWLETLAKSQEYARLLRPAAQVVGAAASASEPPFDTFAQEMDPLAQLKPFVDGKLGDYQVRLSAVSRDLKSLGENKGLWFKYRQEVAAGDRNNSLVALREWAEQNAGGGLAEGSLKGVFLVPFTEAESYLRSDDLASSQWADIPSLYQGISQKFPFSRKSDADLVEMDDLAAFLGGEKGAVTAFRKAADPSTLSPAARQWLDQAGLFTKIFFEKGSDAPRQLRLHLTLVKEEYDPPKQQEDFLDKEIRFYFGVGDENSGTAPADLKAKPFDLYLFGPKAARFSALRVQLALKKRVMGMFGSKFEDEEKPRVVDKAEGAWAPIQLIARGIAAAGTQAEGGALLLTYTLDPLDAKKQKGKLVLTFRAESDDLVPLLKLLKEGLERPPSSAFGS